MMSDSSIRSSSNVDGVVVDAIVSIAHCVGQRISANIEGVDFSTATRVGGLKGSTETISGERRSVACFIGQK